MAVRRRPSGYGEIVDFQSPRSRRSLGVGGLSLPIDIRYRLAYDGEFLSAVLAVFLRVVRGR